MVFTYGQKQNQRDNVANALENCLDTAVSRHMIMWLIYFLISGMVSVFFDVERTPHVSAEMRTFVLFHGILIQIYKTLEFMLVEIKW